MSLLQSVIDKSLIVAGANTVDQCVPAQYNSQVSAVVRRARAEPNQPILEDFVSETMFEKRNTRVCDTCRHDTRGEGISATTVGPGPGPGPNIEQDEEGVGTQSCRKCQSYLKKSRISRFEEKVLDECLSFEDGRWILKGRYNIQIKQLPSYEEETKRLQLKLEI